MNQTWNHPLETRPRMASCPLCTESGGRLVWHSDAWRVIRVEDEQFPAFYRVIANEHVREFSDLPEAQRRRCMDLVCAIERTLLQALTPTKVNLAALGNVVPHLHWHVVARFDWDSRFPDPLWAEPRRSVEPPPVERLAGSLDELDSRVRAALEGLD